MRSVYCIGETVYDIIFRDDQPVCGRPGGSMLNTAVSLGVMNVPVSLIGDCADDKVGDIILAFLESRGVTTEFIRRYTDGRSRIALAFLDANNDAEYLFYKSQSDEEYQLIFPEIKENDIVVFGSFYAIKKEIRSQLKEFIEQARRQGAIIFYDPNFRKAHLSVLPKVRYMIEENIALSHVVKAADEDFLHIYGFSEPLKAWEKIKQLGCGALVLTANKRGVQVFQNDFFNHYPVPQIQPVSTVGAGDSFTAGLVFSCIEQNISLSQINHVTPDQWANMINMAIRFATEVCLSFDNYLTTPLDNEV